MTTVHVAPSRDAIPHHIDGTDCPCRPNTEPVPRADGSYGWVVIHDATDGRPEPRPSRIRDWLLFTAVRILGPERAPRHWACYREEDA